MSKKLWTILAALTLVGVLTVGCGQTGGPEGLAPDQSQSGATTPGGSQGSGEDATPATGKDSGGTNSDSTGKDSNTGAGDSSNTGTGKGTKSGN